MFIFYSNWYLTKYHMLEIITIINLLQSPPHNSNIPEIQTTSNQEFILNNQEYKKFDEKKLQLGHNHLSIFENNEINQQLLIITKQDTCDFDSIYIKKYDYHKDNLQLSIPENCINKSQHIKIFVDEYIEIPEVTKPLLEIDTHLVETAESIVVTYKDLPIDKVCWINSNISNSELKDFQKFNMDKSKCQNAKSENSFFERESKNSQFKEQETEKKEAKTTNEVNKDKTIIIQEGMLRIESVMANSENEHINLKNYSNQTLHLNGLYIKDKTLTKHFISNLDLLPGRSAKIENLKFQINNSDEKIFLFNRQDQLIDTFEIQNSEKDILQTKKLLIDTPKASNETPIVNKESHPAETTQTSDDNTSEKEQKHQPNSETQTPTHNQEAKDHSIKTNTIDSSNESVPHETINSIQLSEIFANPKGSDTDKEYIEIFNNSDLEVELNQYILKVNKKNNQLSGYIGPKEYKTIYGINVTNTNATVALHYNSQLLEKHTYQEAKEDFAFIKINNQWVQTKIKSPNTANGEVVKYSGPAEVMNGKIHFENTSMTLKNHKIVDGLYSQIELEILKLSDQSSILTIQNMQRETESREDNQTNSTDTLTSSMGLLSMASLGIIYSLFK